MNSYDELRAEYGHSLTYTSGGSGQNTMRTVAVGVFEKLRFVTSVFPLNIV